MQNFFEKLLLIYPSSFKIRTYNTNDIIFNEDDECKYLGIVLSGQVIISTITYNEKEEIITIINPYETFGEFLLFSTSSNYLGDCIAKKKTVIAFIKKNDFLKILSSNLDFLNKYLEYICNKTLIIKNQAKLFSHKNILDRIMYYFSIQKTNPFTISSVTDLAHILSIPRESVSRSLTTLQKRKFIKKENNTIYILKKMS